MAANARTTVAFALSPGQAHDAPEGWRLLRPRDQPQGPIALIMDRADEGDDTRKLALDWGFIPVVPPKQNRRRPSHFDRLLYKQRHQIERLFRRLTGFRPLFSRFDKLDVMFRAFILFALIVHALQ